MPDRARAGGARLLLRLKRKLSDLSAWLEHQPGGIGDKLLSIYFAQRAWTRGLSDARRILSARQAEIAAAAAPDEPSTRAPAVSRDNLIAVIAAHADSEQKLEFLLHNIKALGAHTDHIHVHDIAAHLSDERVRRIKAVNARVQVRRKKTSDLLDQSAFYEGAAAAAPYDYCLLMNDSIVIVNSLAPFFAMVEEQREAHNMFALTYSTESYQPCCASYFRVFDKSAAAFFIRYYDIAAPAVLQALADCRHSSDVYRRYYRYSLIVHVFEVGIAPYLRGHGLFGPHKDRRLEGINLYLHDAELFHEYMQRWDYPVIKQKQLTRKEFAYLRDHIRVGDQPLSPAAPD